MSLSAFLCTYLMRRFPLKHTLKKLFYLHLPWKCEKFSAYYSPPPTLHLLSLAKHLHQVKTQGCHILSFVRESEHICCLGIPKDQNPPVSHSGVWCVCVCSGRQDYARCKRTARLPAQLLMLLSQCHTNEMKIFSPNSLHACLLGEEFWIHPTIANEKDWKLEMNVSVCSLTAKMTI